MLERTLPHRHQVRLTYDNGRYHTYRVKQSLIVAIPDVNTLLALEPEELGAKVLFLLGRRRPDPAGFILEKLLDELFPPNNLPTNLPQYRPNPTPMLPAAK